jgi:MYXO-CTERM domain-containing protein
MTYVFNKATFSRIPMGETFVRNVFATSFQTWADVTCGSTTSNPFLVAQAAGTTDTTSAEFLYDQPNESIVVVRSGSEWSSLADHDSLALALTLIWHDKKTGEILDVDMELNGGAGTFTDCSSSCRTSSTNIDLQNTITHEAGHLLGLGHTDTRGATMQPSTTKSPETEKRSLETDDKNGYCALKLPAGPCKGSACKCSEAPVYASHQTIRTCSCELVGREAPARGWIAGGAGLAAVAGVLTWRRRRRSRTR